MYYCIRYNGYVIVFYLFYIAYSISGEIQCPCTALTLPVRVPQPLDVSTLDANLRSQFKCEITPLSLHGAAPSRCYTDVCQDELRHHLLHKGVIRLNIGARIYCYIHSLYYTTRCFLLVTGLRMRRGELRPLNETDDRVESIDRSQCAQQDGVCAFLH